MSWTKERQTRLKLVIESMPKSDHPRIGPYYQAMYQELPDAMQELERLQEENAKLKEQLEPPENKAKIFAFDSPTDIEASQDKVQFVKGTIKERGKYMVIAQSECITGELASFSIGISINGKEIDTTLRIHGQSSYPRKQLATQCMLDFKEGDVVSMWGRISYERGTITCGNIITYPVDKDEA